MFWYPWSESIKKRACRYLLQRYLGNFLEEKLTLDQLSVDLYNGTGTVSEVSLDCEALNELGDSQNWPLEIVDGHMQEITVTVPWSTLLKDDSIVEINGLSLTVQPKVRTEPVSSMLESMWSSMSSSMQLAAECLRDEAGPQESNPVEGIEMFAHAIDSILSRVKVKFVNTKIRIEHVPKNGTKGIALEAHIKNIDYFDEAGSESIPESTDTEKNKTYVVATYTNKKIKFSGITFYIDEFPSKLRTMAPSLIMEKSASSQADKSEGTAETPDANYQSTMSDVFYEARSVISTIDSDPIRDIIEDRHSDSTRENTPEEKASQPDPILFAKLTGHQELTLKLKHSEEVEGPKVEVKVLLGSFLVFMTPRQLHTIIELCDALNQPDLEDTSNIPIRPSGVNVQCKPMTHADFQLIEAQLLGNLEKRAKPTTMHGWSGPSVEDSEIDSERFHPMTSDAQMSESFNSSVSSMSASMTSSLNIPTAQPRIKRNKKVPHIDGDPTAEVSHVSLRIASVSCVLLHKDILVPTPMGITCVSHSSASKLQQVSTEFFARIETFTKMDERKDLNTINESLDIATDLDHLRLLASEISLDGSEKVTSHGSQTMCEAAVRSILVRECLYIQPEDEEVQRHSFDLIHFDKEDDDSGMVPPKSNLRMNFKQTSKYMRIGGERKLVYPTTDVILKCTPFHIDVELTLIERMSATFFPSNNTASAPAQSQPQNHFNFTLHCPNLNAILRFPIADLRPGVNSESRRVRNDYLVFKFQNATVSCQQVPSTRPLPTTIAVKATTLDLYYHENEHLPATHIAQTTMDDSSLEGDILKGNTTTPLPMISITFQPRKTSNGPFDTLADEFSFEPKASNPMTTSMYIMNNLRSTLPSPFSGKKMAHQGIGKHETQTKGQEEELIVPGTDEEMAEFTNSSVENSSIHLDFNLPILSLQLESKQLYEIIYNRINSDLLLWEPRVAEPFDITPHICGPIYPAFGVCKGYDSDSDSSSSEEENLYYSTYDHKTRKNLGNTKPLPENKESESHNFCLTLKVGKGLLSIYAPVRDSNKQVVPGQMGELVLEAQKLSMCQVSGLNGRAKTAQMCLRGTKMTLYHEPILTIPSIKPNLRLHGTALPSHLKKTIYPSNKGVFIKERMEPKDMFTLALKTEPNSDTPGLKTICIALGIEQATLRHRGDKGIAWLNQFMDILDVLDYPVPGYTPSTVLSELHVHVWDCAVDYRPLYLPIRTVATLGNFSVSSNLIPETNTSYLRFLAQECTLFLYYVNNAKPNTAVPQDDEKHPDIHRDYVCVVDVGLFELSLRMADKTTGTNDQPQVDLTASNNMVNMYTCWDSASALCRLLTYVASDGDSNPPYIRSRHTSICSDQLEQLVGLDDRPMEEIRELSPSEIQQVNDLMAEALKESPNNTNEEDELISSTEKEGVEVFFFPDESIKKQKQMSECMDMDIETQSVEDQECKSIDVIEQAQEAKPNIQVTRDLGDPTLTPKASPRKSRRKKVKSGGDGSNTDDEYCIVDTQAYTQDNEMDEPVVNWIGPGPVYMVDNHFTVPAARSDVLKAPKSFPLPVLRYTLCEMSLTWNMYGGNDFRPTSGTPKKTVSIEVDSRRQGSPTAKRSKDYEPYEKSVAVAAAMRGGVSWSAGSERVRPAPAARADPRARGGALRDHHTCVKLCLTKVKFQHEVYPSGGTQASRQTLAITKIEVLDRLVCSDINKLLSQYKLKDEPERKNAHMLVVKAVHLRADAALPAQECCLKVSLLPLRFNLDQDTLAFLVGFFSKLGTDESSEEESIAGGATSESGGTGGSGGSRQTTPTHRPPVMSIASHLRDPPPTPTSLGDADCLSLNETVIRDDEPLMETYEAERLVSENLIQLEEDFQRLAVSQEKTTSKLPDAEPVDDSPIYFRRVVFSPEVPIRLDYVGKRVDLSAGPVAGLLMGLGQLNCSELTLKRLDYKLGLLGLEKLVQWALHEWLSDIKRHQLPGLLSGIGPMHSLLQIITGIRDLVWLPVEQWRRDGRLVHGLRRGAASFTARTAVAALDITARLLHLVQATAETAFDMLTPAPALPLGAAARARRRRRDPARHPADIREGVASAYLTVREGFAETAASMAAAARRGRGAGVLRQLPGAAVAPLALAAAGAADLLGGVRAALAPDLCRDHADKWRRADADDTTD
ncbi:autophagy-related protein 2 homolog A [Zerene cesonia]|uniref:autophagy-related protein 2 homolog A n=1 Tax=Zerene cesonia TaxID=33412 RepID=UPI0018E558AF|nr:autophagy-related protein 2 homolog A [Zerene cesonia]